MIAKLTPAFSRSMCGRARHFLIAFDQRTTATDPQKHLGVFRVVDVFDVESFSPIHSRGICAAEGMTTLFQRHDCLLHRLGKVRFFHHQEATHVDDLGHLFDEDRTSFHAGRTGCALPEGVR